LNKIAHLFDNHVPKKDTRILCDVDIFQNALLASKIPSPIQTVTVGPGVSPGPPLGFECLAGHGLRNSISSPSVGNYTRPRRNIMRI